MTTHEMSQFLTPSRQETPSRQDLHNDCIEDRLCRQLILRNIPVKRQVRFPVTYKGITMQNPLIIDLLVGDKIVVEIKATEHQHPIYKAQTLTYLRLTNLKLGLLLNFGQARLVDGLSRVANGL